MNIRSGDEFRILIFAGHFSEIALRFGSALATNSQVCVLVEAGNLKNEWGDAPLPDNIRIVFFEGKSVRAMAPALILQLLVFRPHVVQFEETTSPWLAMLMRLASWSARTVLRVHDVEPHSGRDSSLSQRVLRSRDWCRNRAALVLVHGSYCRRAFTARYPTKVLETVLGVIHLPEPSQLRRPDPGRLIMFGRLEAYKGLEVLVGAMRQLRLSGLTMPLTIAGRGPELDRLRPAIAQLGNVEVIDDFVPAREVPGLFQRSEIVVLPYTDATQSAVASAAIANGRTIIASGVGGLLDMIEDGVNGILVPPRDVTALAQAIGETIANPEKLAQMEKEAGILAKTVLDWNTIAAAVTPELQALVF